MNYEVIKDNVTQSSVTEDNVTDNVSGGGGGEDNKDGGYYYNTHGYFLNKEGTSNKVYLADKMIVVDIFDKKDKSKKIGTKNEYVNAKFINKNYNELINLAALAYSECSIGYKIESWEEVYSIAFIHYNNPSKDAYGKRDNRNAYNSFINARPESRNANFMRHCITGALSAFIGGKDYSNGADAWDGIEQSHLTGELCKENGYESHAATQGWTISDELFVKWKKGILSAKDSKGNLKFQETYIKAPQHCKAKECYKTKKGVYYNKDLYRLRSVAVHGASIFWKTLKETDEDAKESL